MSMSGTPILRSVALAASAVLLASLAAAAAPPEGKPHKAARAEARAAAKAERRAEKQARAQARAEARAARKAQQAEAKAARAAAKAERKQARKPPEKVALCHKPGTPAEMMITIAEPAVAAHLAHGDAMGECDLQDPALEVTIVTATLQIYPDQPLRLLGLVPADYSHPEWSSAWSSDCLTEEQLVDPVVIASRPNTNLLIVREDVLTAGTTCDFTLAVTDPTGALGTATVAIEVLEPPAR